MLLFAIIACNLLLLLCSGRLCTFKPVVTISSPMEDKEDEEGCDDISTQESAE